MNDQMSAHKLLFIVNPGAGNHKMDLSAMIRQNPAVQKHSFEIFELQKNDTVGKIKELISKSRAGRVIAVGGDGTLKLVAECLLKSGTAIGLIPAGSANGMAKELGIPTDFQRALELALYGSAKTIHAIRINGALCVHLSDIGFNAYVVKKFDDLPQRGMWAYAKAAWQALWRHYKMDVFISTQAKEIRSKAAMVVIANATMYGTGVKINPAGQLSDELFEVILIREYAVMEILKIRFTNLAFDPEKIQVFQTRKLKIRTRYKAHFQVDGEYLGKTRQIEAEIIPAAIQIIF